MAAPQFTSSTITGIGIILFGAAMSVLKLFFPALSWDNPTMLACVTAGGTMIALPQKPSNAPPPADAGNTKGN